MGCCCHSDPPRKTENGTYPWPQRYLDLANESLLRGDPRVVDFKKYNYPVEDPVDIRVAINCESSTKLKLKSYFYPAFHNKQEKKQ